MPRPANASTGLAARPRARAVVRGDSNVKVIWTVRIRRSPEELFQFWRQLENLPSFVPDLVSVTQVSPTESHWVARSPAGNRIEWDAVIFNEHANRLIAWRTRRAALIPHAGSVRFEPHPSSGETEVRVALEYDPPGGRVGSLLAKLTGNSPDEQIGLALRRFKALMETGEMPAAKGQAAGTRRRTPRHKPLKRTETFASSRSGGQSGPEPLGE